MGRNLKELYGKYLLDFKRSLTKTILLECSRHTSFTWHDKLSARFSMKMLKVYGCCLKTCFSLLMIACF